MKRITRINFSTFESLRKTDSGLFHALLEATRAEIGGEVVQVDSAAIKGEAFKIAWAKWVEKNPEAVLSTTTEQDELWQEQQKQATRDAQKVQDEQAVARANWWIAEGNLLPSDHNLQLIQRFIREKTRGLSADNFDLAISQLREQLQWKSKPVEPVAPTPPPPPPPVLIDDPESPTGQSEQLSLDEQPRSRHSKAQLRDWDRRKRESANAARRAANNEVAQAFRNATTVSEITL